MAGERAFTAALRSFFPGRGDLDVGIGDDTWQLYVETGHVF